MNVFLLGNGFDLHHKFPTAYIDFLKTVNYLAELKDCSNIKTVYDVFREKSLQESCKNIKTCFKQHEEVLKKVSLPEYQIIEFKEQASNNLWFKYLSKILNKDLGWIDFEREIAIVIEAFRYYFDNIGEYIETDEDERNQYIIKQFAFFLKDINSVDAMYFWIDENMNSKYKAERPIGSGLYEVNSKQIIDDLYKSLEELQDILNLYLRVFVENVLDKMSEELQIAKNPSYPEDISYIFTFNYTYTIEKISNIECNNIVHIHGDIDNGIILGVNPDEYDDIETIDTTFIKFKKYFNRIIGCSDADFRRAINRIENSFPHNKVHLYVIGHSLDSTDKDVIMELFELANEITIFFHDNSNIGTYTENLVRIYGKQAYDIIRGVKNIKYLKHADVKWSVKNDQL